MKAITYGIFVTTLFLFFTATNYAQTDLNDDGKVNAHDLRLFIDTWQTEVDDPTPFQEITIDLDLPENARPLEMVLIPAGTFTMGGNGILTDEFTSFFI